MSKQSATPREWKRTNLTLHAHFDCFSGAAGDMMLASCLDAAGDDRDKLLWHVQNCLVEGMPELKGEFSFDYQQVWRGMGSIAALHVTVQSKYNHEVAPVPERPTQSSANGGDAHDHSRSHEHYHDHDHSTNSNLALSNSDAQEGHSHDHTHMHTHAHGFHLHSHDHGPGTEKKAPLRNLPQIRKMLEDASSKFIPEWVRDKAIEVFTELAKAEAMTHGAETTDSVHFHEVGAIDSIVDTVGTLLALHALGVATISCSRLPLGEGTVWTDHGLLPVPAPATLRLMIGMPTCPGPKGTTGELVTPTAAALLRVLVQTSPSGISGRPPCFTLKTVGIGAGTKDFTHHPNILRLMLGDAVVEK